MKKGGVKAILLCLFTLLAIYMAIFNYILLLMGEILPINGNCTELHNGLYLQYRKQVIVIVVNFLSVSFF